MKAENARIQRGDRHCLRMCDTKILPVDDNEGIGGPGKITISIGF